MPGRRPSFSRSIGQSLSAAFGKKDGFYFEIEFLSDTTSHHIGEKKQILVDYIEIGRSVNSAVRYKGDGIEAKVSGRHVSITRNGGEWTLEHLSNTNSTVINGGDRIIRPDDSFKRYILQNGDTIQLAKGGPVIRFIVPENNSIQSVRKSSRGTTFIQNIVGQAIAPYKKSIRLISVILGFVLVGFVAYAAYTQNELVKYQKIVAQIDGDIETIQNSYNDLMVSMDSLAVDTIIIQQDVQTPNPVNLLVNPELQNIKKDIYFIQTDSVVFIGLEGRKKLPKTWMGTGFLLSDGRFVTARHCVEPWIQCAGQFTGNDDELLKCVVLASSVNGCRIKSYFHAYSTLSRTQFAFTSDDFVSDNSRDIKNTLLDESGAPLLLEDGTPLYIKMASSDYGGSDWVYSTHTNGKRGSITVDIDLSMRLQVGQQLLVIGFPNGFGVNESIDPVPNETKVLQPVASNGVFIHSGGTDPGNSGGPLFAQKGNRLVVVGIVSGGVSHHNVAVPIKNINNR